MLNDKLEDSELEFQITQMHKQGITSFIARTFAGLHSDYPGNEFLSKMRTIINTAKKYSMEVYLQAKYMPAAVPALPDEYTQLSLIALKDDSNSNIISHELAKDHGHSYVIMKNERSLDMLNPDAMEYYLKTSYDDFWKEFEGEFGYTCKSIWVDEPSFSPPGLPWTNLPKV